MTTKEIRYWLHNLEVLKDDITQLQEDLAAYRDMEINEIHVTSYGNESQKMASTWSLVESEAIKKVDLIQRTENEMAQKRLIQRCITNVISKLRDSEREIIKYRYIAPVKDSTNRINNSWEFVSQKVNLTAMATQKMDGKIILRIMWEWRKMCGESRHDLKEVSCV